MELSNKKKREILNFAYSNSNPKIELDIRIRMVHTYGDIFGGGYENFISNIKSLISDEKIWDNYQNFNRIMRENVGVVGGQSTNYNPKQISEFRKKIVQFGKDSELW